MNKDPFISIIIPLYNKEKYIRDTLQSCVDQTYHNFEVIVIDDGSKDNSADIVKSFADKRIRYVWQENAGVSVARNHGLSLVKGEWFLMLDADDILSPYALSLFTNLISRNHSVQVVVGQVVKGKQINVQFDHKLGRYYTTNNPYRGFITRFFYPCAGTTFVHCSAINKVKYIEGQSFCEDILYYLSLMEVCKNWAWHKVPVLIHPTDGTGLSASHHPIKKEGAYELSKKKYKSLSEALCYQDLIGQCQWARYVQGDNDGLYYYDQMLRENFSPFQRWCYRMLCRYRRFFH